ncbi:MAG: hypothetical protein OXU74_05295 [Gemmatimonadota bacterium]|nr:hypothetical protein [Gemmatimonadota bacterium]
MRSRWTALLAVALPFLPGPGAAAQVTLGIGVGASSSDLIVTGLVIDSQEPRRGIALSLSLAVPLSERIGIEFGTGYIRRGSTSTLLQLGDVDYRIQYLQLSALGKASAPVIGQRLSVHLLAGPALALETSCEREARLVLHPITFLVECDAPEADSRTATVDYGILAGVGARLAATSRLGFRVDFIYSRGLRSFFENETETTAKNRALTLQAGVDFQIG